MGRRGGRRGGEGRGGGEGRRGGEGRVEGENSSHDVVDVQRTIAQYLDCTVARATVRYHPCLVSCLESE